MLQQHKVAGLVGFASSEAQDGRSQRPSTFLCAPRLLLAGLGLAAGPKPAVDETGGAKGGRLLWPPSPWAGGVSRVRGAALEQTAFALGQKSRPSPWAERGVLSELNGTSVAITV